MIYKTSNKEFRFNDLVEATFTLLPLSERIGRLVQVRKGCGQFGSDILFLRLKDGLLRTFENVGLQISEHKHIEIELEEPDMEYTIRGEYPEKGFIVEKPQQPQSESPAFGITITHK